MQPNNPYYQPQGDAPQQPQTPPGSFGQPTMPPAGGVPGMPQGQGAAPGQPQLSYSSGRHGKPIVWIIVTTLLTLLLISASSFGYWAFTERDDYKNNSDQKVAVAVEEAKKQTTEENNARFAEEYKKPLKEYQGPAALGSIKLSYPKTWSAYVDQTGDSSAPLIAMFHPDFVPAVSGGTNEQAIALTVSVFDNSYDAIVSERENTVSLGELKATPYALPKMSEEIGMRFVGKITQDFTGTEIVIPLRDKTLVIKTETDKYLKDFNELILPNMTFVP